MVLEDVTNLYRACKSATPAKKKACKAVVAPSGCLNRKHVHCNKVVVTGFGPKVQEDDIYRHFNSVFGPVLQVLILAHYRIAVVTFVYERSANEAVKASVTRIFGQEATIEVAPTIQARKLDFEEVLSPLLPGSPGALHGSPSPGTTGALRGSLSPGIPPGVLSPGTLRGSPLPGMHPGVVSSDVLRGSPSPGTLCGSPSPGRPSSGSPPPGTPPGRSRSPGAFCGSTSPGTIPVSPGASYGLPDSLGASLGSATPGTPSGPARHPVAPHGSPSNGTPVGRPRSPGSHSLRTQPLVHAYPVSTSPSVRGSPSDIPRGSVFPDIFLPFRQGMHSEPEEDIGFNISPGSYFSHDLHMDGSPSQPAFPPLSAREVANLVVTECPWCTSLCNHTRKPCCRLLGPCEPWFSAAGIKDVPNWLQSLVN